MPDPGDARTAAILHARLLLGGGVALRTDLAHLRMDGLGD
jgi:hypothetical protein